MARSGGTAGIVQLLYVISGHLWGVGGWFFGLWLIPMGWLVVRSRLTVPTTIGELWIIGYLIVFGVRVHVRPDRENARVRGT